MSPNGHPPEMSPVAPRPGEFVPNPIPDEEKERLKNEYRLRQGAIRYGLQVQLDRIEKKLDWLRWAMNGRGKRATLTYSPGQILGEIPSGIEFETIVPEPEWP